MIARTHALQTVYEAQIAVLPAFRSPRDEIVDAGHQAHFTVIICGTFD
jgi:hypothetical protein